MFSPDGQHWWDGEKWVPAGEAPHQPPPGPSPGPPTGPPPRAKRSRKPLLIIGSIALILIFGACMVAIAGSGSGTKAQAKPTVAATRAPTATVAPAVAAKPADSGTCTPQPCANDNNGWIVQVSELKYDAAGGYGGQHHAEAGNVFVTMSVVFTNRKSTEQHADAYAFVLQDGTGVKHTATYTEGCGSWSAVNVTPGAAYGPKCLAFEAAGPDHEQGLILVWTPGGFGGGDYRIKLS
jgi:hypothetical protein